MIEGSCHCGNVKFTVTERPKWLTSCNCSICRRHAALWAHLDPEQSTRMAVNFRMCSVGEIAKIRVRHLDGADTWAFKD